MTPQNHPNNPKEEHKKTKTQITSMIQKTLTKIPPKGIKERFPQSTETEPYIIPLIELSNKLKRGKHYFRELRRLQKRTAKISTILYEQIQDQISRDQFLDEFFTYFELYFERTKEKIKNNMKKTKNNVDQTNRKL